MTSHSAGLRNFLRDSALTFSQQSLSLVLGFSVSIILARSLGREGVGILTLVFLFPTLITTFVNFGVPAATVYFLGSGKYKFSEVLFNNLSLSVFQSILGLSGAFVVLYFFKNYFFSDVDQRYLYWIMVIIPITLINMNLRAVFQAISDFKSFNATTISRLVGTTVFLVVLLFLHALTISTVIFANILAEILTLFLVLKLLRRHIHRSSTRSRIHVAYLKDALHYGARVYISSIFTFFNYKQDRFLLNSYLSPISVGVYNVGANFGERLWLVSKSVSTVIFPKIASLKDNESQRRWMTPFISRHIFTGTAIAAAVLFWLTPFLIHLFYGEEFANAASVLRIILPGVVFLTVSRILSNDIAGRGRPGINMILAGVSVLINLVANILLIPRLGVYGAAWASTFSYTISSFLKIGVYTHIAKVPLSGLFILRSSDFQVWLRLIQSSRSTD